MLDSQRRCVDHEGAPSAGSVQPSNGTSVRRDVDTSCREEPDAPGAPPARGRERLCSRDRAHLAPRGLDPWQSTPSHRRSCAGHRGCNRVDLLGSGRGAIPPRGPATQRPIRALLSVSRPTPRPAQTGVQRTGARRWPRRPPHRGTANGSGGCGRPPGPQHGQRGSFGRGDRLVEVTGTPDGYPFLISPVRFQVQEHATNAEPGLGHPAILPCEPPVIGTSWAGGSDQSLSLTSDWRKESGSSDTARGIGRPVAWDQVACTARVASWHHRSPPARPTETAQACSWCGPTLIVSQGYPQCGRSITSSVSPHRTSCRRRFTTIRASPAGRLLRVLGRRLQSPTRPVS